MNIHQYKDYTSDIMTWARMLDENMSLFIGRTVGDSDNIFTNTAMAVVNEIRDKQSVLVVGTSFCALQKHILEHTDVHVEGVGWHYFDMAVGNEIDIETHLIPSGILDVPLELSRKNKRYDTVIFLDTFSSQTYLHTPQLIQQICTRYASITNEVLIFETLSIDEYELESHETQSTYWAKEQYEEFFSAFTLADYEAFDLTPDQWIGATYDYWMANIENMEAQYSLDPTGVVYNLQDRQVVSILKDAIIKLRAAVEQDYIRDVIQMAKLRFVIE